MLGNFADQSAYSTSGMQKRRRGKHMRSNSESIVTSNAQPIGDVYISDISISPATELRLLEAREDERRQIARDLHDVTAQLLLELEFALNTINNDDGPLANRAMVSAHDVISKLQSQVRCVSYLLHPPELSRYGLERTLESLALGMSERSGIAINFRSRGYRNDIPRETQMTMLRIAQEALMNIFKHSQSDHAEFHLYCNCNWICMRIRDFGIGSRAKAAIESGKGVGLASIRERVASLGGVVYVRAMERGTAVTAFSPLTSNRAGLPRSKPQLVRVQ